MMKRLLPLASILLALCICSCTTEKASTKDEIGDEEYRVMSAVLKGWLDKKEEYQPPDRAQLIGFRFDRAESLRIARKIDVEEARMKSLFDRFGSLAWDVRRDTLHSKEFFDTLIQRFGRKAYLILRDSINGKIAYDSLHHKFGDLDYYVTVWDTTRSHRSVNGPSFESRAMKEAVTPEMMLSYRTVNEMRNRIDARRFAAPLAISVLRPVEFDSLYFGDRESWRAFCRMHPLSGGIVGLSRIGFSADTSLALAYFSVTQWGLSAAGTYYLLQKTEGQWKIVAEELAWIT